MHPNTALGKKENWLGVAFSWLGRLSNPSRKISPMRVLLDKIHCLKN
jgi:hypothetical protein